MNLCTKSFNTWVKGINKLDAVFVPEGFQDYLKEEHLNQTLEEAGSMLDFQMEQAAALYRYAVKHPEWRHISQDSLQTPSDPDATYRNKGGKGHIGLSVNLLVEVRDQQKKAGQILSHDMRENTHSDAAFGESFIQMILMRLRSKRWLLMEFTTAKAH
ncbi:hypothetical protein [Paenibacillus sp. N3.4]|uniref:hypothetical protein n=1 Tax=Paenibacillus sp. N3.4 TaxID=2603222 RepID=UPI0011C99C1F|nr:hypothetical protein [Paenibacillus sp. N3.4]TXK68921.1 hypothetical protein FU659_34270 [Paenibacillus sp. N3.4]